MAHTDKLSDTGRRVDYSEFRSSASVTTDGATQELSVIMAKDFLSSSINLCDYKPSLSFMENRKKYRIIHNGLDVTPYDIVDPNSMTMEHHFTHAAYEPKQHGNVSLSLSKLNARVRSALKSTSSKMGLRIYATVTDLDDIKIKHTINTAHGYRMEADLDPVPSAYYLPKDPPLTEYPQEITITLKETSTVYLYDLPRISYDFGTTDAKATEKENAHYQFITDGMGRNRKVVSQETQTNPKTVHTRHSLARRPRKKNQMSYASMWDIHDSKMQLPVLGDDEKDEMVMIQHTAPYLLRENRIKSKIVQKHLTWESIAELPQFNDAVLLCERVLAAKAYGDAQKIFRGLSSIDLLSPDIVYTYTMKLLWCFKCDDTDGRPISSISINPKNPNIIAVGYGKFRYAENLNGIVCVWCTKNPCFPERMYRFEVPVTSVSFSNFNPNWLAVSFANGEVCILDVISCTIKIVAKSKRDTNPSFEPIWTTSWHPRDASHEYLMTAGQDGRINRFTRTKTHDFICVTMMRISAGEGIMQGLETPKSCFKVDVPIIRNPAALCIRWHPIVRHKYLVGTDEGCIHKCSKHYLNQHMDVFKAHAGPVYNMIFSPFMPELLATCGADNAIRIWMADIDDVLITLNCSAAVYDIAFSPVNSSILISASGNMLSVWDLRRKTHGPCTEYLFRKDVILTYVKFSTSGYNLFVGDTAGRIHTFHLEDTPIPPYNQRQMLVEAIKKALCTRPQLLLQIERLEKVRNKHKSAK